MIDISGTIEQAKLKYPLSVQYKGRITESEMLELEKLCDVSCSSVYMDGSGYYTIRYRFERMKEGKKWDALKS